MSKEVSVYKEDYYISRFNDESVKITGEQFSVLEKVLLDTEMKFVKIGERIINVSTIKEVIKVIDKPNSDMFAETGSNPLYREWCETDKTISFKEWLRAGK